MTERLRVLHLDHTSAPGGAELALVRLVREATTWAPTVALPRTNDLGPFAALGSGPRPVERVHLGPPQRSGAADSGNSRLLLPIAVGMLRAALAIRRSEAFARADLVHTNTSRSGVYGAIACAGTAKRLVVHLRDAVDVEALGRGGFELFTRVALPRADGVIANSRSTLATARPWIKPHAHTAVVPSAIGLQEAPVVPPLGDHVAKVGMLARIDPWKGQEQLLRAFARCFRGTPTRLCLAGGTSFGHEAFLAHLQMLTQDLGISNQVDFLGHLDDVPAFLADMDICVHASTRAEPLGQNVLQYLAYGRPTIAVDAGGPAEWIRHGVNGLLFPLNSQDSLALLLQQLSDDPELRARLGRSAAATPNLLTDAESARRHADLFLRASNDAHV